ncbi:peptidyl-prolyl cis-trans isomerase [Thermoproteota archaeon]
MKRIISLMLISSFFLIYTPAGYCFKDKVIAVINNEVITEVELDIYIALLVMQFGENRWKNMGMSRQKALDSLIEDRLLIQEARNEEMVIDEREIDSKVKRIRKGFSSEYEFNSILSKQGILLAEFKNKIEEQILSEQLVYLKVRNGISVSPKEVTQYYSDHKDGYDIPERITLESVSVDDSLVADGIYEKLKEGVSISEVKENFSGRGSELVVAKGDLLKEIEGKVFDLEIGEFSKPIKIEGQGYFIFLLKERHPKQSKKLIDVQEEIKEMIFAEKFSKRMTKFLDKIKKNAYIEIKDE